MELQTRKCNLGFTLCPIQVVLQFQSHRVPQAVLYINFELLTFATLSLPFLPQENPNNWIHPN
eukprot:3456461-Amphidinium_carterae.1